MKITDNIVKKFDSDKIMHYLVGAWIVASLSYFGWIGILIGVLITIIISFIKEKWLDTFFDKYDIFAALLGNVSSIILYLIYILIL